MSRRLIKPQGPTIIAPPGNQRDLNKTVQKISTLNNAAAYFMQAAAAYKLMSEMSDEGSERRKANKDLEYDCLEEASAYYTEAGELAGDMSKVL